MSLKIVLKVADTVEVAAKIGIRVGWIHKVVEEIGAKKHHYTLLREARLLRIRIEELQHEMEEAEGRLGDLDIEMVCMDFVTHATTNYKIQIVKKGE